MAFLLQCARRFNGCSPWHQIKPSIAKRAARLIDTTQGPQIYDNVMNRYRMKLDLSVDFQLHIYMNASNQPTLQLLKGILKPGDRFIDAGANVGLFTLAGAGLVGPSGKVWAFEPQPGALEFLTKNVELNALNQVEVVPHGVWHEDGQATLHLFEGDEIDLPSLTGNKPGRAVTKEVTIRTVKMDDVVTEPVKAIKMDVEGAELSALKGSERLLFGDKPPHLFLELNEEMATGFGYKTIDILDFILKKRPDYQIFQLKTRRVIPSSYDKICTILREHPEKSLNVYLKPKAG
ncbi:MAG TPA: hypothetical protein DCM28_07945 [Phycisphaerales bacterium]|nr:hypothetical protein [Phycisphaerales bacterium]HCD34215.1 hypothetical protein [Phycisphaerales bacterium]|tara:strand:- start:1113 stop:1985 length:873 start_codon:yes stop_codon:yes gene_type:complete